MTNKKRLSEKSLSVIITMVLWLILVCGGRAGEYFLSSAGAEEGNLKSETNEVQQELSTFSLEGYGEGGKKSWEIVGASADMVAETVKLDNVVAKAYSEENAITLTADAGWINQSSKDIRLERNITATTDDGATLETDYLEWRAEDEIVATDREVWLKRKNIESSGKGAVAKPNLKKVQLNEEVMVRVQDREPLPEDSSPATIITCDGPSEIDYENNSAIFNKNVKVDDPRGNILGEKIEVSFDPASETITRVIATGNVKILRDGNTTYSETAVYDAGLGKVTLTGNPRLVIYQEKMKNLKQKETIDK